MTIPEVSIEEVRRIIGSFSIESVRNWLKRCELPSTARSRDELAAKIHGQIAKGELTLDGLSVAIIGIEEASAKRTFLYRVPVSPSTTARIEKQLADLHVTLSDRPIRTTNPSQTTKVVYVVNSTEGLRAKWTEIHTKIEADRIKRQFKETKVPKSIVLIINKMTGLVQLRCDKPEDEHSHPGPNGPTDDAYFAYFREQAENLTGLPFEPIDLRTSLEKLLKATPRIIKTSYTVDQSDDGGYTKRAQKQNGKDVRDLEDWQQMTKSRTVRTFEESPVHWLKEMSGRELHREVFSYIYANEGQVRFDADCYEEEIAYVLSHLV